jgi:hypothetical protein
MNISSFAMLNAKYLSIRSVPTNIIVDELDKILQGIHKRSKDVLRYYDEFTDIWIISAVRDQIVWNIARIDAYLEYKIIEVASKLSIEDDSRSERTFLWVTGDRTLLMLFDGLKGFMIAEDTPIEQFRSIFAGVELQRSTRQVRWIDRNPKNKECAKTNLKYLIELLLKMNAFDPDPAASPTYQNRVLQACFVDCNGDPYKDMGKSESNPNSDRGKRLKELVKKILG